MNLRTTTIGVVLLIALVLSMNPVSALGLSATDFGEVMVGETKSVELVAGASMYDPDNYFTTEVLECAELEAWITFDPEEFWMNTSRSDPGVMVSVDVPVDAEPGEYEGYIKIAGGTIIGDGTISFTVATKALVSVTVLAVEEPMIIAPAPSEEPTIEPTLEPTSVVAIPSVIELEPDPTQQQVLRIVVNEEPLGNDKKTIYDEIKDKWKMFLKNVHW